MSDNGFITKTILFLIGFFLITFLIDLGILFGLGYISLNLNFNLLELYTNNLIVAYLIKFSIAYLIIKITKTIGYGVLVAYVIDLVFELLGITFASSL